jgi:hypothetical protein
MYVLPGNPSYVRRLVPPVSQTIGFVGLFDRLDVHTSSYLNVSFV